MNTLSNGLIIFGMGYLVYSLIFRNDITIYVASKTKYTIHDKRYVKIQLAVAIINSMLIIVSGLIIRMQQMCSPNILIIPLIFNLVNLGLFLISKKKGLIKDV